MAITETRHHIENLIRLHSHLGSRLHAEKIIKDLSKATRSTLLHIAQNSLPQPNSKKLSKLNKKLSPMKVYKKPLTIKNRLKMASFFLKLGVFPTKTGTYFETLPAELLIKIINNVQINSAMDLQQGIKIMTMLQADYSTDEQLICNSIPLSKMMSWVEEQKISSKDLFNNLLPFEFFCILEKSSFVNLTDFRPFTLPIFVNKMKSLESLIIDIYGIAFIKAFPHPEKLKNMTCFGTLYGYEGQLQLCKNLVQLHLEETFLANNYLIQDIGQLIHLVSLSFKNSKAPPFFTEHLTALKNLKHLSIENCCLPDSQIQSLKTFTQLETLNLSKNPELTHHGILKIKDLTNLHELFLHGCPAITSKTFAALTSLSHLTHISMDGPPVLMEEEINDLNQLPHLKSVYRV